MCDHDSQKQNEINILKGNQLKMKWLIGMLKGKQFSQMNGSNNKVKEVRGGMAESRNDVVAGENPKIKPCK